MLAPTRVLAKLLLLMVVAVQWQGFSAPALATEIDFDRFAAVAFSPSTGEYGYGWDCPSRWTAETAALRNCPAADAKVVGWVKGGWLVLAIGHDNSYGVGWEFGNGAVNTDAARRAIARLKESGQTAKTLVYLCSGDIDPVIKTASNK